MGQDVMEDAPHQSGTGGAFLLAVRKDVAAALAGSDGDYIPLITDNSGKLWVNSSLVLPAALAAGGGLKVEGVANGVPIPSYDAGPSWTTSWGIDADGTPKTSADLSGGAADVTVAPTAGQKLVIDDVIVSADANMRIVFTEETSNKVRFYVRVAANTTQQITLRGKMKMLVADKKLRAQSSAAGNVEILVGCHSEA